MNPPIRALFRPRLILCAVLLLLLLGCGITYNARSDTFAPPAMSDVSFRPSLTNPEVLKNWLPAGVYAYTIARIHDYLRTNATPVASLRVVGSVNVGGEPAYSFILSSLPNTDRTFTVGVSVSNDSGIISTNVTVNGELQSPRVPSAENTPTGATSYAGFDSLISYGFATIQTNELQQALEDFDPTAAAVTIDTTNILAEAASKTSTTRPYSFPITIDDKTYTAKVNAIGLLQLQLQLIDQGTKRQIFDSGIIDQGS